MVVAVRCGALARSLARGVLGAPWLVCPAVFVQVAAAFSAQHGLSDNYRTQVAAFVETHLGQWHAAHPTALPPLAERLKMAEREVVELHAFFVRWFRCDFPPGADTDALFDAFLDRFDDGFEYVFPGGEKKGKPCLRAMRGALGSNADFRIHTHSHSLRPVPHSGGRVLVGTYKEMQKGARNCGAHNGNNGRITTALLLIDRAAQPNGVRWLRIHECWLPDAEIAAFDFSSF